MRWIALSEPYSLSSQITGRNQDDDPSLGAKPMFSRFYLRQMEAEQLYESLITATKADNTVTKDRADDMKERWIKQFSQAFGTDENDESTTFNGSIPQALTLMNGELVQRATGNQPGSMVAIVFFTMVILLKANYKRCSSNQVLVIFGKTSKGQAAKTVHEVE